MHSRNYCGLVRDGLSATKAPPADLVREELVVFRQAPLERTDDGPVDTGLEQQELAIFVGHYDAHMVPVAQRYRSKHRCG
jgi:hypothetical protein